MANAWFRLYSDSLDDPKLMFLPRADVGNYFLLLALKCEGGLDQDIPDGRLDEYVGLRLRISFKRTLALKARLMEARLIDEAWQPTGWNKRQRLDDEGQSADGRKREKDRLRLKAWRERQREDEDEDETHETPAETPVKRLRNAFQNASDTDTDTDTEKAKAKAKSSPAQARAHVMPGETPTETPGETPTETPTETPGETPETASPNIADVDKPLEIKEKDPEKPKKPPKKINPLFLKPDDVSERTWCDFINYRKIKRADITENVIKIFRREANKAGIPLEDAINYSIYRCWQGFFADWYNKDNNANRGTHEARLQHRPDNSLIAQAVSHIERRQHQDAHDDRVIEGEFVAADDRPVRASLGIGLQR